MRLINIVSRFEWNTSVGFADDISPVKSNGEKDD